MLLSNKKLMLSGLVVFAMLVSIEDVCAGKKWFAGLIGGYVMQNEEDADSRTGYGFTVGRKLPGGFDIGLYGLFTGTEDDTLGWTMEIKDNFALIALNYHLPAISNLYAGVKFGMADRRAVKLLDKDMGSIGANGIGYGLEAGYEYNILSIMTLGVGVNYLYAGKAERDHKHLGNDIELTFEETSFVNLIVTAKLFF